MTKGSRFAGLTWLGLLGLSLVCQWVFAAQTIPLQRQALTSGADFSDIAAVNVAPTPRWVVAQPFDKDSEIPEQQLQNGVYFLLSDFQFLGDKQNREQQFRHFAIKINNVKAVEDYSQLSLQFDPSYEQLQLHQVTLYRHGQTIDKLKDASHSVERHSQSAQVVDGSVNLRLLLTDVRVGDILEYAYTVTGVNPVFDGHFYHRRPLQWNVPIAQQFVSVLWRRDTPLQLQLDNASEGQQLVETHIGDDRNYQISLGQVEGLAVPSDTPNGYDPRLRISFSDFADWSAVATWGWQLFAPKISQSATVISQADLLSAGLTTDEAKATAALDFVQQQIRYLGLEMGVNSHLPATPEQTLRHRFGDCKDKTVLLVALLHAMGIQAEPVLVNTDTGEALDKQLPSAKAFNHAIVQLLLNGQAYFVDPTISFQKGIITERSQPFYGYGLVLSPTTDALTLMPREHSGARIDYAELFNLSQGDTKAARYQVTTHYWGTEAERLRERLASTGSAQLATSYADFYREQYGELAAEPLVIDDRDDGLTISEQYTFTNPWQQDADGDQQFFATENQLSNFIEIPSNREPRPYALSYPLTVDGTITLKLFDTHHWDLNNEHHREKNAFFDYQFEVNFDAAAQQLRLHYRYQSLTPFVTAADFPQYIEALKRIQALNEYGIVSYNSDAKQQQALADKFTKDVLIIIGYWLFAAVLIGLALAFWQSVKQPQHSMQFYSVPWHQVALLSLLTLGGYFFYWSFRNWHYLEQHGITRISAIWWTLFAPLTYLPLALAMWRQQSHYRKVNPIISAGFILFFVIVALVLIVSVVNLALIPVALWWLPPTLALLPLVALVSRMNRKQGIRLNPHWQSYHLLLALAVLPFYAVSLAKSVWLLPQAEPTAGNKLWPSYNVFLQQQRYIKPNESADYFYTDSYFDFRDQGVGFSDSTIFSYRHDQGKSTAQQASFAQVREIQVESLQPLLTKTEVTVVKHDGSRLVFRLPADQSNSAEFIAALKAHWQQYRHQDNTIIKE
ncbi:DUF3857 domain-containing protein [Shewanella avicenniae]|uniref:DUF3857 domain-containing protein n=1 Tax=Shewanella avicenniae TaxID=2814294 RepID=A0ABX7QW00_9GAMM|nr:DUF3857 domain-containing protein [Shewanella avicenniae]QSX35197.1 DUF3857 domain-containing protein [Shewanella avicenniae]